MDLCYVLEKQSIVPSQSQSPTLLLDPPKKLTMAYYRCDNKFHLDAILEMFDDDKKIGVCLVSGKELLIYVLTLSGSHIDYNMIRRVDIVLANKHNKGGQSSNRFGRIVQIVRNNYVDIIVQNIVESYMYDNNTKCIISKLVLAGPGVMKNDVANTEMFKQYMHKYLHKIIPTNNFDDGTVRELAGSIFEEIKQVNIKGVDIEINNLVQLNYDSLAFGKTECLELIDNKNISKLFVNKFDISPELKDLFELEQFYEIIVTDSLTLKTYGNWVAIRKY